MPGADHAVALFFRLYPESAAATLRAASKNIMCVFVSGAATDQRANDDHIVSHDSRFGKRLNLHSERRGGAAK